MPIWSVMWLQSFVDPASFKPSLNKERISWMRLAISLHSPVHCARSALSPKTSLTMRALLREGLKAAGSTKDWSHITDQIGMFAYTGLSKEQVQKMRDESAVYCTLDGRISVAGLNRDNVAYVAAAIHAVSK